MNDFVTFGKENRESLIKTICKAVSHIPPRMNDADYRFQISGFICYVLEKYFPNLKHTPSKGYDILYECLKRISLKAQREIYQRKSKKSRNGNELTLPKVLVMTNKLGDNAATTLADNFDYLLSIQRGVPSDNGYYQVGFGIIAYKNIPTIASKGDQLKVTIYNHQYDYFSGVEEVKIALTTEIEDELNKRFMEGMASTYEKILEVDVPIL